MTLHPLALQLACILMLADLSARVPLARLDVPIFFDPDEHVEDLIVRELNEGEGVPLTVLAARLLRDESEVADALLNMRARGVVVMVAPAPLPAHTRWRLTC